MTERLLAELVFIFLLLMIKAPIVALQPLRLLSISRYKFYSLIKEHNITLLGSPSLKQQLNIKAPATTIRRYVGMGDLIIY